MMYSSAFDRSCRCFEFTPAFHAHCIEKRQTSTIHEISASFLLLRPPLPISTMSVTAAISNDINISALNKLTVPQSNDKWPL